MTTAPSDSIFTQPTPDSPETVEPDSQSPGNMKVTTPADTPVETADPAANRTLRQELEQLRQIQADFLTAVQPQPDNGPPAALPEADLIRAYRQRFPELLPHEAKIAETVSTVCQAAHLMGYSLAPRQALEIGIALFRQAHPGLDASEKTGPEPATPVLPADVWTMNADQFDTYYRELKQQQYGSR